MTRENLAKHEKSHVSPYVIISLAWCFLGIGTGFVASHVLARLIFIGISWFLFEAGWDYLEYYKRMSYSNEDDQIWNKLKLRVISYSRPLFYVWLGTMVHHIIWWQSDFMILDRNRTAIGWGQSSFVILCTTLSFLGFFSKSPYRRNYLKWAMMIAAFLIPPYRDPWFTELLIIIQARWMVMAILFAIQCFESYAQANTEKKYLSDLYLLRIGWVPIVHPLMLLFSIISLLYYGFTMFKIKIESTIPQCEVVIDSQKRVVPQVTQFGGVGTFDGRQPSSNGIAHIMEQAVSRTQFYDYGRPSTEHPRPSWEQYSAFMK